MNATFRRGDKRSDPAAPAAHSPLPISLRRAGDALCGLAALASVLCATLLFLVFWSRHTFNARVALGALSTYDTLWRASALLLRVGALGGIILIGLGLAYQARRLWLQGICCLSVALLWWYAAAVYTFFALVQFSGP